MALAKSAVRAWKSSGVVSHEHMKRAAAGIHIDTLFCVVQMLSMKMVASREFSARPGAVWADLEVEGSVVVTRDGVPVGIITATSPATLLEDMREIAFAKARHAAAQIRQSAAANGTDRMSLEVIDAEIRASRKARGARKR